MAGTGRSELASITIDSWLKELRMECYKRNLDTYPDFESLLLVKDAELKKLGIHNAGDRSTMINSLSSYIPKAFEGLSGFGSKMIKEQIESKKKGTPMRKLKGLLGGGQRKSKRSEIQITSPKLSYADSTIDSTISRKVENDLLSQSLPENRHSLSLEDLFSGIVENVYVPDPHGSPQLSHPTLQRSYTISDSKYAERSDFSALSPSKRPVTVNYGGGLSSGYQYTEHKIGKNDKFDHLSPKDNTNDSFVFDGDVKKGTEFSKHLSIASMESGLGLTCESDDNFNTSLALEEQPWFHGKIKRNEAEAMLQDDGDFLVHENFTTDNTFVLSLMWDGRCYHKVINCDEVVMKGVQGGNVTMGYKYQFDNGAFDSVPELIFNHLRYQIPISRDHEAIIRNPVYRPGCKMQSAGYHLDHQTHTENHIRTLPKNFSYTVKKNTTISSPDLLLSSPTRSHNNTLKRTSRSASFSPADSPRRTPDRETTPIRQTSTTLSHSTSTSNLLYTMSDIPDEDEESDYVLKTIYKDVPDSPPSVDTTNTLTSAHDATTQPHTINPGYDTYDFPTPSANIMRHKSKTSNSERSHPPSCISQTSTLSDSSDYQHPRPHNSEDYEDMMSVSIIDTLSLSPSVSPLVSPKLRRRMISPQLDDQYACLTVSGRASTFTRSQPGVKYAEVGFKRSNTVTPSDFNAGGIRGKHQPRVTYVTTQTIKKELADIEHYATPPQHVHVDRSMSITPPSSTIKAKRKIPRQASLDLLRPSRPTSILSRNTKCPQTIQDIPAFLKEFTNDELAMHLTKADGVSFLLTPRPAEDFELWTNRIQESAPEGVFVGLQTLASTADGQGAKLWKKLFHRHLSLSQLVTLCIIHNTELIERVKALKKWIEIGELMQSGKYGNLFSFMAIMKGLESPQVLDLKKTWESLKLHYSDTYDVYENQLKGMISALMQGASVYSIRDLTIPAIQHLRKLYNEDETFSVAGDLQCMLEDFTTRVIGLDGLRNIICYTAELSDNARKRLSSYSFDTLLFDFFMQDVARMHLQTMGTMSEEPLERYRRFNIVLDSLFQKLDNP